jgi:predicted PurR-regulated permease PerM
MVLFFVILYFNYILIGDFLSTILFAIVISLAIKPYKDNITEKIEFMIINKNLFVSESLLLIIFNILKEIIIYILNIRKNIFNDQKIKEKDINNNIQSNTNNSNSFKNKMKSISDLSTITILKYATLIYLIIFKMDPKFFLFLIFIITLIDFLIKISVDFFIYFSFKFGISEMFIDSKSNKTSKLKHIVHSFLTSLILILSIIIFMVFMFLSFFLLYKDLSFIYNLAINQNNLKDVIKEYINVNLKDIGINFGLENNNNFDNSDSKTTQFPFSSQIDSFFNPNFKDLFKFTFGKNQNSTLIYSTFNNNTEYSISNTTFFKNKINGNGNGNISFNRNNFSSIADIGFKIITNPKDFLEEYISKDDLNIISKKCEENSIYNNKIMKIISFFSLGYINQAFCFLNIIYNHLNQEIQKIIYEYSIESYQIILHVIKIILYTLFNQIWFYSNEIINRIMLTIIFFSCLFYILSNTSHDKDIVNDYIYMFPLDSIYLDKISKKFKDHLQGVFITSFEIFLSTFLITWVLFDFNEVPISFVFSLTAGVVSLLPVFSPYLILFPSCIFIFMAYEGSSIIFVYSKITLFVLTYILSTNMVLTEIYKSNFSTHPYVTGLVFVSGFYSFGFFGIIYGPSILCISSLLKDILSNIVYNDVRKNDI